MDNLGYNKLLFILPFDHRSTFAKGMFGASEESLTEEIIQGIKREKQIIYKAFKKAIGNGIPLENAAILAEEQFGDEILKDARENGYVTILTTEKSGQNEFEFEYGEEFSEHIEKYDPTFVKVLVRYNPDDDPEMKNRQIEKLKKLSDYCHVKGYKFLAEILIVPTENQLAKLDGDKNRFDKEERSKLAARMIEEFQDFGIEPDVWKMEGLETQEDYGLMTEAARKNGRDNVGIVILGRGAGKDVVDKWIMEGAKIQGIIGFAVGRTVFWEPLTEEKDGKISEDEAIAKICDNFVFYYNLFMNERKNI